MGKEKGVKVCREGEGMKVCGEGEVGMKVCREGEVGMKVCREGELNALGDVSCSPVICVCLLSHSFRVGNGKTWTTRPMH